MRYDNYSSNDFANVMDKFARGRQIHQHTFMSDYTAENIFYSAIGWVFQSIAYLVLYPIVYIIVNLIKLLTQKH